MRAKRLVNAGLAKAGYAIVRRDRVAALASRQVAPPPPPPRPRGRPGHVDAAAQRTIEAVRPRTMTSEHKLFALIVATRYVVDHGIPGAIVECGVWRGGSQQAVAYTLLERGVTDRDLHLFDTFEGMTEPGEKDVRHDGRPAAELLERSDRTTKVWAVAGLDDVRAGMAETGYPAERVHFHPGPVEDTIPGAAPDADRHPAPGHGLVRVHPPRARAPLRPRAVGGRAHPGRLRVLAGRAGRGRGVPRPHGCASAAGPHGVWPDRGQALSGT